MVADNLQRRATGQKRARARIKKPLPRIVELLFLRDDFGMVLGIGDEKDNDTRPDIYNHGLVTVGERSRVPDGVGIGKNSVIAGECSADDFPGGMLPSGSTLIKGGERR